jgi:hypothetical protein
MAQIRFEDIQDVGLNSTNTNQVGFFSLKNDGDEAVVRIMHDDTSSFDIVSTHGIQVNGKFRRVNCCRSPYDPVDICPLCASGNASQQRFYIHLIHYEKNEQGQIVAVPKVWERSVSYAKTVKDLITTYGPLSNVLLIIRRNGAAGSMDTKYSIMYAPPQMFNDTNYPKVGNEAFEGYTAIGNAVMNRTPEEVATYVATGNFPMPKNENKNDSMPNFVPPTDAVAPMYVPSPEVTVSQVTVPQNTAQFGNTSPTRTATVGTPNVTRPVRYY